MTFRSRTQITANLVQIRMEIQSTKSLDVSQAGGPISQEQQSNQETIEREPVAVPSLRGETYHLIAVGGPLNHLDGNVR